MIPSWASALTACNACKRFSITLRDRRRREPWIRRAPIDEIPPGLSIVQQFWARTHQRQPTSRAALFQPGQPGIDQGKAILAFGLTSMNH